MNNVINIASKRKVVVALLSCFVTITFFVISLFPIIIPFYPTNIPNCVLPLLILLIALTNATITICEPSVFISENKIEVESWGSQFFKLSLIKIFPSQSIEIKNFSAMDFNWQQVTLIDRENKKTTYYFYLLNSVS